MWLRTAFMSEGYETLRRILKATVTSLLVNSNVREDPLAFSVDPLTGREVY
jgi:hypothetical protein